MIGCELEAHLADQFVGRRVEVDDTAFRCDARIPRDHLDAALCGFLQGRDDSIRVVGRNGDGIHALRDQGIDDLDLTFRRRGGRAGIDDLYAAQFLRSFLRALVGSFKEAVAERLRNKPDLHVGGLRIGSHEGNGQCSA